MTEKPKRSRMKRQPVQTPMEFAETGLGAAVAVDAGDRHPPGPKMPGRGLPDGFNEVETTTLLELDSVPEETAPMSERADFDQAVSDALVKVVPVLRASERDSYVDADVRRRVLDAGARACVIRPVVVPDVATKAEPERARLNPRDELRRWVGEHMPAARDEVLDALLTHCDRILSEVGL